MHRNALHITFILVFILSLLFTSAASANQPDFPDEPRPGRQRPAPPAMVEDDLLAKPGIQPGNARMDQEAPQVALGQPGTTFRYVQTFGETEVAYFEDAAHLNFPYGVGLDGAGNLWVAEWYGARAMKYSPAGSHLMTIGKAGFIAGEFYEPVDVTVDSGGNIWVVDWSQSRVVQYDSGGNYLIQLGETWNGGTDNDHFSVPVSVAIDSSGNIYVSDGGNHRIQIFDSSGAYLDTIGESGVSGTDNAHFDVTRHIAIDNNDYLYVADRNNHRVQIFDPGHNYVATLGVTGVAGAGNGHFDWPTGVAADASYIYVADGNNNRVQIFNRATKTYLATLGTGLGAGNYQFEFVSDVGVDTSGNIYVSDLGNTRIQKYNSARVYQHTFGTTDVPYLTDGYHYNEPTDVAIDPSSGAIGIVEGEGRGHRFIKLDAGGSPLVTLGQAGWSDSDNAHFSGPEGVAFDMSGKIYVADSGNARVQIFSSSGVYQATLGSGYGSGNDEFTWPVSVAVGTDGKIYVADTDNHRVQVFNSSLVYQFTLGETGVPGTDNQHFNAPFDVEVDSSNNIYVTDAYNHRVQKFNSAGAWQMTLGTVGECGEDFDHFCEPWGVAIDSAGRIFVADRYNQRVQVFTAGGAYLTTIGGFWGPETGRMVQPTGVAVDGYGNVYIADHHNQRIEKFAYGAIGWAPVNINGFGDPSQDPWAIYSYNNALYASFWNFNGTNIYRFSGGIWQLVAADGFGHSSNYAVDDFVAFNGQLYAGMWNYDGAGGSNGGQIWRSPSGNSGSWTQVVSGGFNDPTNAEVMSLESFNGYLYAGTWTFDTAIHGAEIWRSSTGNAGSWSRVASDLTFGSSNTGSIMTFQVFNNQLYAATLNGTTGGEVWRTSDGAAWTQVNVDGFGTANNSWVVSLEVFNGFIYVGTGNSISGGEIWRSANGTTWSKVVPGGFGSANNRYISSMIVHDGLLYAVVFNRGAGAEVWRSNTGDAGSWHKLIGTGFGEGRNVSVNYDNITAINDGNLFISTFASGSAIGGKIWVMLKNILLPYVTRH